MFDAIYSAITGRSPKWPALRRWHLRQHPECAACGRAVMLEVHHIEPFHVAPERELDRDNLLTLCDGNGRSCHYAIGHCYSWAGWNPDCIEDAARMLDRVKRSKFLGGL